MSEEKVEIVRRLYDDFGLSSEGLATAVRAGLIAADAEFDYSALYPDGRIVKGVEARSEYLESLPWGGSLVLTPERFLDVDDERVLVFSHASAEGEGSGVSVEARSAAEITVRDRTVVRVKLYKDRADALAAAGISE